MVKQRNNSNQKKKMVVVRKQRAPAKRPVSRALTVARPLAAYRACLADPFSLLAQGARVPDMYSVATTTRHITRKFTLASNVSGECDVVVLPSAFMHAISPRGSIVGGTAITTGDGAVNASYAIFTTAASLAAQLSNYRVVGYGVKVIGIASMTSNSGSITIATVPAEGVQNNASASVGGQTISHNNPANTVAATLSSYGVPNASSVVSVASLPSLPNSFESSLINVSERPITVTPKICSPSAFRFKLSSDVGPGFNIAEQTSAVFITAGNGDYLSVGGHESVIIAATGCPASTSMLDIEITYHLEGNPFISTSANTSIGADASATFCDPVGWLNVLRDVAAIPSFKSALIGAGNSFYPGLGTMAGHLM